jgi:antitoxin HigA-1
MIELRRQSIECTVTVILRLSKAFGTMPELWLNLQNSFDVRTARQKIAAELDRIEPVNDSAA